MSYKSNSRGQSCSTGDRARREKAMHKEKEFEAEMTNKSTAISWSQ